MEDKAYKYKPIRKECNLCTESKCIEDTFDMISCAHSCCKDCAKSYFTQKVYYISKFKKKSNFYLFCRYETIQLLTLFVHSANCQNLNQKILIRIPFKNTFLTWTSYCRSLSTKMIMIFFKRNYET